jgi:hypothetical protein
VTGLKSASVKDRSVLRLAVDAKLDDLAAFKFGR